MFKAQVFFEGVMYYIYASTKEELSKKIEEFWEENR